MNLERCPWGNGQTIYEEYHDNEWGRPVHDDKKHFEMFLLETFQAGLSWITILKKRENFRSAFSDFEVQQVANYDQSDVERLMNDTGIIRNRKKIEAAIKNAGLFIEIQGEFGSFDQYIWHFTDHRTIQNSWSRMEEVPTQTELSDQVSNDLKKRGFSFVGSVTVYSHLQAIGIINDHLINCPAYVEVKS